MLLNESRNQDIDLFRILDSQKKKIASVIHLFTFTSVKEVTLNTPKEKSIIYLEEMARI